MQDGQDNRPVESLLNRNLSHACPQMTIATAAAHYSSERATTSEL